ncbi:hypothetical protein [Shewanella sp. MBTL60-007]|uniref:hypothetical protein n=1 Tax=Shewanella sp. MBTL60-007 TaxID=2815911 RepID=UPI001BC35564|nr:hypothetical protein [Shewanella sp. MBTL60-007]GIU12963.1 hypothetical protein TUM3792_02070 [Shewanella sp. MBTL60-007]
MSAIANFKKRCDAEKANAEKAQQAHDCAEHDAIQAPVNEALALLACLLGCEEHQAIEKARRILGAQNALYVDAQIHVDPAAGDDKSAAALVTNDDDGAISDIKITDIQTELEHSADTVTDAAQTVEQAADSVTQAADKVETAANNVSETSSDLAYSAESISEAASDIKEATEELKKPLAEQASSRGEKDAKAKKSSKK